MWIWIIAISALILAAAATVCSAFYFFRFAIARPESPADPNEIENPAYDGSRWHQAARKGLALMRTLPREEITRTSRDGLRLHATFFPAEQPSSRTVLAIHGYKSCGLKEYSLFLEFYRSMGFNLLLPDNRAHGQSEGKYIGFGNPDRFDCVMWAEYLADRFGKDSFILLHGVSMGAATVLSASGESLPPQVKGIVSDCSYTSAWDEFKNEMQRTFHLPPFPILPLCEGICKLRAGYGFRKNSPLSQVTKASVPILFIHGKEDSFVPTQMVYPLYEACPTKKRLFLADGAGHAESMAADPEGYRSTVQNFLEEIEEK